MSQPLRNALYVVAQSYDVEPFKLIKRMVKLGNRFGIALRGVVVSNGSHELTNNNPDWMVLRGSSNDLDFSAYFEGATFLKKCDCDKGQITLFVNETFFTSRDIYGHFASMMPFIPLMKEIELPAMVGRISRYYSICYRNPWSDLDLFVPSYYFALNRQGIEILLNLSNLANEDGVGQGIPMEDKSWGSKLNPQFYEYLRSVIGFKDSPYFWVNYDKYSESSELITKKARCIYFEHRLSGEIARDGCVLPINAGIRMSVYVSLRDFMFQIFRNIVRRVDRKNV